MPATTSTVLFHCRTTTRSCSLVSTLKLTGSSPPIDLGLLDEFLHEEISLPDDIAVDIDGELILGGSLSTAFKLGVDLSSLQDGITLDELFVELDDLTFTGQLQANDLDLTLGYGPLTGSIENRADRFGRGSAAAIRQRRQDHRVYLGSAGAGVLAA